MLPTFANWVKYFDSLPLSEKVNKSHLKALLREFNGAPDATTCETKLEREHESVYMTKLGIGGSMKLFHHFKSNKTFCTNKGATVLIGMDKRNTQPFKIEGERLLEKPTAETPLPVPTAIFGLESAATISTLTTGSTVIKARNFTPVPPFLVPHIHSTIQSKEGSALLILLSIE